MPKNLHLKLVGLLVVLAASFAFALPAKAFYLEMPKIFHEAVNLFQSAKAEDTGEVLAPQTPSPVPVIESQPQSQQPIPYEGSTGDTSGDTRNPPETCFVNGVEQPGTCIEWNQKNKDTGMQGEPGGGQGFQGDDNGQKRQDEQNKRDEQNNQRMLKDMQRGVRDIERQLKQFELMIDKFAKKGIVVSDDTKTKISDLRALVEKYKAITTVEEAAEMDMQEMWDKMRELEAERQHLQRMENVMREMRRIESGVKMFDKQVQKLIKQKLAVSEEITSNLEQVKALIADIKNGKMDDAESIFELMQSLDEHRQELEMLARWPQTVKQMNQELKNLTRELKKVKLIVDRLVKKGIDLTSIYSNFELGVNQLKDVIGAAGVKVTESAEEAFDMVQSDFFGQLEDVWENHKIIMTMSNMGRFNSDFKRGIANDSWQIKVLKKKKIDTIELEDMLEQAKAKGAEALELFKAKPLDPDAIIDILEEMQNLKQDFEQKKAELTGIEEVMPWETGIQQFKKIDISPNLDNWIPKKAPPQQPTQTTQQTCNINGVETPGPCEGTAVKE